MQTKGIGRLAALLLAALLALVLLPGAALALTADGAVETAEELINALNAGGEVNVKLGANITLTTTRQQFAISGKTVTLDLNGFALTREGTGSSPLFSINNGGKLTINDQKGGGSITSSYPVELWSNSTFVLNGGDLISAKGTVIDIFDGAKNVLAEMNGGSAGFTDTATNIDNVLGIRGGENVKVNINGGEIAADPDGRLAVYISGKKAGAIEVTIAGDSRITATGKAIQAYSGAVINVSGNAEIHSENGNAISTQSGYGVVSLTVGGDSRITTGSRMSAALSAQEDSSVIVEGNATVSSLETSDSASAKVQGSSSVGKLEREDSSSLTVTSCRTDDLANVKAFLDPDAAVAKITDGSGSAFYVGEALETRAAGVSEGDEIDVLSGDVALTNLPDGVTVKNSGGGTVSANGKDVAAGDSYTVETPLAIRITAQPRDAIVTEGETATFTIAVEGGTPYYQWRKSTDGGRTFAFIAGENGASYTTSATTVENDGYRYDCLVIEEADKDSLADLGSLAEGRDYVQSSAATLTVKAAEEEPAPGGEDDVPLAIRITAQPRDAIVTEGETATFTIAVEGGTPYYQWRKSTDGGRTFAFIAGENGASYTTSATTVENDGYRYDCLVIEEADKDSLADLGSLAEGRDYVQSSAATLTVKAAEEEPAPGGEDDVPPTGEGPLLYVALGVAALCLLGLALPALRRGNRG